MKIFLIYIIIGWAISTLKIVIDFYGDDDLNDSDYMIESLFVIAYWLPMLFILGVSYALEGIFKLISYIRKK